MTDSNTRNDFQGHDFQGMMDRDKNAHGEPIGDKFTVLDAVSYIQRLYVIESKITEELPREYFTMEQIWQFFKVGFKGGVMEGLFMILFLPFMQVIYPSFKIYFLGENITNTEMIVFEVLSYAPMAFSTIYLLFLGKYYSGNLTKRAIFSLLNGRSVTFFLKGVAIYFLMLNLQSISLESPNTVYTVVDYSKRIFEFFSSQSVSTQELYEYYFRFIIPALSIVGRNIFLSMMFFALMPYMTVFFKGYRVSSKRRKHEKELDNY